MTSAVSAARNAEFVCAAHLRTFPLTTGDYSGHLKYKHGYSSIVEFKMEFNIPMSTALTARDINNAMKKHGNKRRNWFRQNVMPKGIELSKRTNGDMVPKEIRAHSGKLRRGQSWIPEHTSQMKEFGWINLHEAALSIGISYNYVRKCATDGRLNVIKSKRIRFTRPKWVEDTRKLLEENRKKYNRPR